MDTLLHKLCEKSEAELWEMVKIEQWTPDHAKVAFFLTEIMKGVKKIEHLKKLDEAMEQYDKEEKQKKKSSENEDEEWQSEFARSGGGRRSGGRIGGRGGRGGGRYAMFGYDEDEDEGEMIRKREKEKEKEQEMKRELEKYKEMMNPWMMMNYSGGNNNGGGGSNYGRDKDEKYYENKYRELLEDKWEKEKKEKENKMPPPSTK